MLYWLICLAVLAAGLLFIATLCALAASARQPFYQAAWPRVAGIVLIFLAVGICVFTSFAWIKKIAPVWLFPGMVGFTVVWIIGIVKILRAGLKKVDGQRAALGWNACGLSAAFGILLFVCFCLFAFKDICVRLHMEKVRSESTAEAVSLWPPPIPAENNALTIYERASRNLTGSGVMFGEYDSRKEEDRLPKWFGMDVFSPDFDAAAESVGEFLKAHRATLDLMSHLNEHPEFHHPLNVRSIISTDQIRYSAIRNLTALEVLAARRKVFDGDLAGAYGNLEVIQRIPEHLKRIPTLMSVIMGVFIDGIRFDALEYVLAHDPAPHLAPVSLNWRQYAHQKAFSRAIRMEAAGMRQVFAMWDDRMLLTNVYSLEDGGDEGRSAADRAAAFIYRVFLLEADEASWLAFAQEAARIDEEPYEQMIGSARAFAKHLRHDYQGIVTKTIAMDPVPYKAPFLKAEAQARLTALAMAAYKYKDETGSYPAAIEDLVPRFIDEVPPDPFDQGLLKMKAVPGGLDLYSVGRYTDINAPKPENREAIHFFVGRQAWEDLRLAPAVAEKANKKKKK